MRIAIIGPGAMGCLVAACLARIKQNSLRPQVFILDKDNARAAAISRNGIKVEGVAGQWRARLSVAADAGQIKPADLAIVCTKSYDTQAAAKRLKDLVGAGGLVLTLQNGLGNVETISEIAGEENVIGGVTNLGATLLSPGCVRYAGRGETIIGRPDGRIPAMLREIREVFNRAGLTMRISRDIRSLIWSKLIINVGINALTAISRLNNGRLTEFEGVHRILKEAVTEAVKVAKRKRIKLVYDDPLSKVEAVCQATATNVSSMLADVLRRRRTEIDFINGAVVRQGRALGVKTPVNEILVDIVKTIEASYGVRVESSK
ncbi:MAG: ketopantoate reductase family protein [Candidatus Omnitrophota bacterium]